MPSNQICKNFINEIAPIIQKVAKERGYAICSTVIAQACIESAYGTSSLGYKYHNYFGMKCGSSWQLVLPVNAAAVGSWFYQSIHA